MLTEDAEDEEILPPLKGLSFLDRFLVVWIILAMAVGIVLGNTVDSVGPALRKGEFVGVSIPIGTCHLAFRLCSPWRCYLGHARRRGFCIHSKSRRRALSRRSS